VVVKTLVPAPAAAGAPPNPITIITDPVVIGVIAGGLASSVLIPPAVVVVTSIGVAGSTPRQTEIVAVFPVLAFPGAVKVTLVSGVAPMNLIEVLAFVSLIWFWYKSASFV
jgi:hypothetical protein